MKDNNEPDIWTKRFAKSLFIGGFCFLIYWIFFSDFRKDNYEYSK